MRNILAGADVCINGSRPWDIEVHDNRFYTRLLSAGALGLGESYMDGWWDCEGLAELFCKLLGARLDGRVPLHWEDIVAFIKARLINRQKRAQAVSNVHRHYDLGNDLYRGMLGPWMLYSCVNWERAGTLAEAGEAKLSFVCRELGVRSGDSILDIGCGWGGFAKYAAEKCGARVVGITLSVQQAEVARRMCGDLPVEIRRQDYRDLRETFDHVVSLGMFEHVGRKNYRSYMEVVRHCLKPHGRFFLSTIGANDSRHRVNAWTDKYIFPGGMLPSISQIGDAADGLFVLEEMKDWSEFYEKTLVAWFNNFNRSWAQLKGRYGDRFYRMWKYYLLSSAGAFRAKTIRDWQIVFSSAWPSGAIDPPARASREFLPTE